MRGFTVCQPNAFRPQWTVWNVTALLCVSEHETEKRARLALRRLERESFNALAA
jgi:hypothetical protein